jgi:hypothetical protein
MAALAPAINEKKPDEKNPAGLYESKSFAKYQSASTP